MYNYNDNTNDDYINYKFRIFVPFPPLPSYLEYFYWLLNALLLDKTADINTDISEARDGKSDVAEPSFAVGKSPENMNVDSKKISLAGGLGEGSPKVCLYFLFFSLKLNLLNKLELYLAICLSVGFWVSFVALAEWEVKWYVLWWYIWWDTNGSSKIGKCLVKTLLIFKSNRSLCPLNFICWLCTMLWYHFWTLVNLIHLFYKSFSSYTPFNTIPAAILRQTRLLLA